MHSDLNANPYHFLGRSPTGKISSNRLQNGGNMLETLGGGVALCSRRSRDLLGFLYIRYIRIE